MRTLLILIVMIQLTRPSMSQNDLEMGVSLQLATARRSQISNVQYKLKMDLVPTGPIHSQIVIEYDCNRENEDVILDFNVDKSHLKSVRIKGVAAPHRFENGHLVIAADQIVAGKNQVEIQFIAGDPSLNRNEKFLYTLLVPDRASTVFPCFDQPDIKARFQLTLSLPQGWIASANGKVDTEKTIGTRTELTFANTKPISTYLFAFAAGEFQKISKEIDGRQLVMFHRETDQKKLDRNVDDLFRIHAFSLDWMEEYTGIPYPFSKFHFVLIPSFPYGGMEHTGNIFYNANSLLLEQSATQNQKLNRASLIAHETAHMWFGNLVTMKWFDDVWLKEVFANFMAAKIVHPSFPEINHRLGFMLKHHPSAYGEDRSRGTYPIQQKLDNLRNAGTLYGRIIYMKAPIVMRQLETIIGQSALKSGLREYLNQFQYGNATWDDLIGILDSKTDVDLHSWSAAWVKESGTPEISSKLQGDTMSIRQTRQSSGRRYWGQQIDIKVSVAGKTTTVRAMLKDESTKIAIPIKRKDYDFYLTNGSELGYGYFLLDSKSKNYLLEHVHEIKDDVTRGAAWLALYESMIRGEVPATEFMQTLLNGLKSETESLNRQNLLNELSVVYWKFLSKQKREQWAEPLETTLWKWIDSEIENDARAAYFKTLNSIVSTPKSIQRLYDLWKTKADLNGLPLAETDYITLAYELAIRLPDQSDEILETQLKRIENGDRQRRFQFVMPALSPSQATRDQAFEELKNPGNRRPERWALDRLHYLHHPLRAQESEKYILPSLKLLEEIQTTGDIFFPKRWLVATFSGHRSKSAASIVETFLAERPEYPFRLRNKILQAADLLFKVVGN